jgi:hypothetical protein
MWERRKKGSNRWYSQTAGRCRRGANRKKGSGNILLRVAAGIGSTGGVGSEGEAKLALRLGRAEVVAMVHIVCSRARQNSIVQTGMVRQGRWW